MSQNLQIQIDKSGVVKLTLNRPNVCNAFDDALIEDLISALTEHDNDQTRVLILNARGTHFSAGADLSWMKKAATYSYQDNLRDAERLAELMQKLNSFTKPTIAAIQGPAFGGAIGLICCCDIAVTNSKATFCFSETKLGLIPAVISPYIISAIGERATRRYFLTAETINAEQAKHMGLVHEVVPASELEQYCDQLAQKILNNKANAVSQAKKLIQVVAKQEIGEQTIKLTTESIAQIRVSPEAQDSLKTFLKKKENKS